jgi:hypothetical protein
MTEIQKAKQWFLKQNSNGEVHEHHGRFWIPTDRVPGLLVGYANSKKELTSRTVLVKCLVVDSDGYAVDGHGKMLRRGQPGFYEWEKRRRSAKWLADPKNRRLWKPAK